ncbi:MAG: glycosyltransferase [Chloroflexi bacterium]|nr:MAG: glycosyltransferase [Chloroflexota bacterium]
MGRFGPALGLAGGAALVACGLLVIALAPLGAAWSAPAGLALAVTGFAVTGATVVGLRRGPDSSQAFWTAILDAVLLIAALTAVLPVLAIIRGSVELFAQAHVHDTRDAIAYALAFTGLLLGGIFFAYAVKYYLSTGIVLLSALLPSGRRRNGDGHDAVGAERQHASGLIGISRGRGNGNGNGNGRGNGNGNGNGYYIDLGYHPFVSVHVAAYNEKRVIERLLNSLDQLEYPAYEVVLVDDSTDESVQILQQWVGRPKFKILHRNSRQGFKGGALREALKVMDPRTEYVVVFDADSMPFPDSVDRFLPYFYDRGGVDGAPRRRDEIAAVQSYQWHVLNKSESWLTEAVRAEYAGSYMVERPFQDAVGALKMVAGTAYMIRADILRQVGWGTSLTEDWELTLKLHGVALRQPERELELLDRADVRRHHDRPHPQRSQMVLADHGVALRQPDREARVRVRCDVLPAGSALRAGLTELADLRCRLPHARARMDRGARLVAPVLEHLRLASDEPRRLDPRGGAGSRPAGRARSARALIRPGSVPGLGRSEGTDQKGRGAVVPHAQDWAHHRRGPSPAPAAHAAAVAARPARDAPEARHAAAVTPSSVELGLAPASRRLDRGGRHGDRDRPARVGLDQSTDKPGCRQSAVPPWIGRRSMRGFHHRPDGRHAHHGLLDPVPVGRCHHDLGVDRPARADDHRRRVDVHHVLDRRQREHARHRDHQRGRRLRFQLRAVRACGAQRRHDVDHDVRREWRQHHEPIHREHERKPNRAVDSIRRFAVRAGRADSRHRWKAIAGLRRRGWQRRHAHHAAERRGA